MDMVAVRSVSLLVFVCVYMLSSVQLFVTL